jgi:hypothetical protein
VIQGQCARCNGILGCKKGCPRTPEQARDHALGVNEGRSGQAQRKLNAFYTTGWIKGRFEWSGKVRS